MARAHPLTTHVWRDLVPRPGDAQMAIDEALLEIAQHGGPAVFRIYRWSRDTVSLGANEGARRSWNRGAIEAANVQCVRRPTGGRAVWHSPSDLTYALTTPLPGGVGARAIYRNVHERLANALSTIGLGATLAAPSSRLPGLAAGACFDAAVGGEVLIDGYKTIGSAQLVRAGALLQHGAIARVNPLESLNRFAAAPDAAPVAEARVVLPDAAVIADAVIDAWRQAGANDAPRELTDRAEAASIQHAGRYRSLDWTWRR